MIRFNKKAVTKMQALIVLVIIIIASIASYWTYDTYFAPKPVTINVLRGPGPAYDAFWEEVLPKFTEETGIRVEQVQVGYAQRRTKTLLELQTGSDTFDVIFTTPEWIVDFFPYLEPLDEYIGDINLTDFAGYTDAFSHEGKLYGLPWFVVIPVFIGRADILAEYGISLGTDASLEEILEAIKTVNSEEHRGLTMLLRRDELPTTFSHWVWMYGGEIINEEGKPVVNSTQNLLALETMIDLAKNYGPSGATSYWHDELKNSLLTGESVFGLDFTPGVAAPLEEAMPGKFSYTAIPRASYVVAWGWVIPKASRHKEAAAKFIQWVTSKEAWEMWADTGKAYTPPRLSLFNSPKYKTLPYAQAEALSLSRFKVPRYWFAPKTGQIRDYISIYLDEVLAGRLTPKQALDALQQRLEEMTG